MYVFVSIDKAAYNIAIICKKYNVTVVLKEIGILDAENETCEKKKIIIRKELFRITQDTIHVPNFPMEVKIKLVPQIT